MSLAIHVQMGISAPMVLDLPLNMDVQMEHMEMGQNLCVLASA